MIKCFSNMNHQQSNSHFHCQECGSSPPSNSWILHNLRHKASIRRLCTNCVLKNNLSLFCPFCFDFYDHSPPPSHQRVLCFRCPSISHLSCVPFPFSSSSSSSSTAFLCPLCSSDPPFNFFSDIDFTESELKSAKAIVVAARVAAQSMRRAAADARVDAERKIKVAVFAKKQARLALERLANLEIKEMERERSRFRRGNEEDASADFKSKGNVNGEMELAN